MSFQQPRIIRETVRRNFNTDQGSQFTGAAFTGILANNGIAIGMDGKGASMRSIASR